MKKIYLAFLCAIGGLTLQSCLHDDKEFFDDSAANRIESTVENTKSLLESAENGWELHYFTGEQYSGGGYTFLLKFQNGKVTVGGDAAIATSTERATSSYDVNRSMGPVLTFNTNNSILHALGTPTYNNIQGEQGDWEFVVTKLTQDSIYVRGKKWGNNMIFTRVPQTVDWKEHLDSIADVQGKLKVNYTAGGSDDVSKLIELNNTSRRIAYRNNLGQLEEYPYVITTKGIQTLAPVHVGNSDGQELEVAQDGHLLMKGKEQLELVPYVNPIDTWIGEWSMGAMVGSCDITISQSEEKADSLIGVFKVDSITYQIGLTYDATTGNLHLGCQDIADPTFRYAGIWFINADLSQGSLLGQGGMNIVWHGLSQEAGFEDDGTLASEGYHSDTFVGVALDASGQIMRDEQGFIFPITWYYVSSLTPNK